MAQYPSLRTLLICALSIYFVYFLLEAEFIVFLSARVRGINCLVEVANLIPGISPLALTEACQPAIDSASNLAEELCDVMEQ